MKWELPRKAGWQRGIRFRRIPDYAIEIPHTMYEHAKPFVILSAVEKPLLLV